MAVDSGHNGVWSDAGFFAPLGEGFSNAANGEVQVVASIVGVLFPRGPAAVLWRVWAVIVYSVQFHAFWFGTHVCVEVGEIIPALANGDASAAISRICGAVLVEAPLT